MTLHPLYGSQLPTGWELTTVDSIKSPDKSSCVAGPFGSKIASKYFVDEGVPVIRGSNLQDDLTRFVPEGFVFVSADRAASYAPQHVRAGDLVFTCWGTIGQVGLIPDDGPFAEYIISNKQLKLRANPELTDHLYLFYYFAGPAMVEHIRGRASGSAVPGINLGVLKSLPVVLPPLATQRRIAATLNAYDELINNNTRRIQVLDEMAQAIYREWFVEFRYPGHEGVPLVDSDLGPIPQTSRVVTVSALAADQRHAVTSGPFGSKLGRKDYASAGVPVIRGANLAVGGGFRDSGFVYVTEEKADDLRSSLAGPGDIVVTQRGTLGQVGRIPDGCRFPRYVLSQSQMKVTVDAMEASSHYLYAVLRSPEATERIQNMAMSAGVPHINLTMLRDFRVVLPHRDVQRAFESVAGPMLDLVESLQLYTERLRATRDLLLPRLISGEIDVSDLEIDVADAAA